MRLTWLWYWSNTKFSFGLLRKIMVFCVWSVVIIMKWLCFRGWEVLLFFVLSIPFRYLLAAKPVLIHSEAKYEDSHIDRTNSWRHLAIGNSILNNELLDWLEACPQRWRSVLDILFCIEKCWSAHSRTLELFFKLMINTMIYIMFKTISKKRKQCKVKTWNWLFSTLLKISGFNILQAFKVAFNGGRSIFREDKWLVRTLTFFLSSPTISINPKFTEKLMRVLIPARIMVTWTYLGARDHIDLWTSLPVKVISTLRKRHGETT